METKICKKCGIEKELVLGRRVCAECFKKEKKIVNKKYNNSHKEQKNKHNQEYYINNIIKESERKKIYYINNTDTIKARKIKYKENNRDKIKVADKAYRVNNKNLLNKKEHDKYINNPNYRLKKIISATIRNILNGTKNNLSIAVYLPYSIQELKDYLELLFAPWMTWENHGNYDVKTWDDNDQSTWTWQIDHIIPQSDLPYTSMEDENFKKCWSLDNLRPLSSKQNIIDGALRIRHNKRNN